MAKKEAQKYTITTNVFYYSRLLQENSKFSIYKITSGLASVCEGNLEIHFVRITYLYG
jgi:hypothetical protein